MEYRCVDAGTEKCPCVLMEAGQCYTCRMSRDGVCACGKNWRGSCPYTVWLQQGGQRQAGPQSYEAPILAVREYAPHLSAVTLSVPRGLAQSCRALGTYFIVESLGWQIPLSVLRSTYTAKSALRGCGDTAIQDTAAPASAACEEGSGRIEIALQPAGPKSRALLQNGLAPWRIRGPFYGGLTHLGSGALDAAAPLLVIAKGTALAPFVNVIDRWDLSKLTLLIDADKLTAEFLADYLRTESGEKVSWQPIRLISEMPKAVAMIRESKQTLFLASPYYTAQAKKAFTACCTIGCDAQHASGSCSCTSASHAWQAQGRCLLLPNHANICCGIGICGACSETDADGMTVRKCKCQPMQNVIE